MVRQQDSNNSIQLFPCFTGSTSRRQPQSIFQRLRCRTHLAIAVVKIENKKKKDYINLYKGFVCFFFFLSLLFSTHLPLI